MEPKLFETLFNDWKARELAYQKANKRKYLHFDRFIQFHRNIQFFKNFLFKADKNVSQHSFYPFIKSDIITPRLKHEKDPVTNKKKIIKKKKIRPIAYASHFDSFIYSWYTTILSYHYEKALDALQLGDCSLAYRSLGKNNIDFAYEVFESVKQIATANEESVALAFDLSSFFDGIDHAILKQQWLKVLNINASQLPKDHYAVYKTLTDYTFVRKEELDFRFPLPVGKGIRMERICSPHQFRDIVVKEKLIEKNEFFNKVCDSKKFGTKCGIPQGSPISACLSNVYMLDFDKLLNGEAKNRDAIYRRYCDDLIVVCKKDDWEYFHELIVNTIKHYEVVVNKDKTEVTFFKRIENGKLRGFSKDNQYRNLQYLGFEFNGNDVYIRSSSMSRYARRLDTAVGLTVNDAYCTDFGQQDFIYRKNLFRRFTDKGSRNFISYGKKAHKKMGDSKTIKSQIKNSVEKVERLIDKKRIAHEAFHKINGTFKKTMK